MRFLLSLAALAPFGAVPPYVQAGTPTSMDVIWSGKRAAATLVLSDAAGRPLRTLRDDVVQARHVFRVTGLTPGTTYSYVAKSGDWTAGSASFHTNNGPDQTAFRFAVVGDSGSGNANQLAVAKQMVAWKPDFVLHTGDVVYEDGQASGYQPRFVEPYKQLVARTVMYPTLGNHDVRSANGQPYLAFFDLPGSHPGQQERWYTFHYGHAQFFALDSNAKAGPESAQYAWLKRSLSESTARWKVAYFHHPFYSSGWEGSSPWLRGPWEPLFKQYGVNVVFNGHDHDYERISPQGGITYCVTGGGGAYLRKMKRSSFTAAEKVTYHFVGVSVAGEHLNAEAIDLHGQTFDRWAVNR